MNYRNMPIMLVDDETRILQGFSVMLSAAGYKTVITVEDSRKVLAALRDHEAALIVLDQFMPNLTGLELLPKIIHEFPQIPVVMMTAANKIETAVECMKKGAFDYLVKPVEKDVFLASIKKALEMRSLRNEVSSLREYLLSDELKHEEVFAEILTKSPKMRSIFQYVEAVASSDQPVMITGDTGVGKELVARAVHELADLDGDFVAVNVAGLDDNVFSDTLFGHKKGAFTDAQQLREGLIAKAAGGTLFLDEIGDLDESSQIKLLRLLQERQYYTLGSDSLKNCDARIIVATNKSVQQLQNEEKFRKDLYFRLCTHHIHIPPLRERVEDIPLLLNAFVEQAAKSLNKEKIIPPPELYSLLCAYSFPGNVREFKGMVFDAVARHQSGPLSLESFKQIIGQNMPLAALKQMSHDISGDVDGFSLVFGHLPTLKEAELYLIDEAMKRANGRQALAASYLGLTRQALNKRLSRRSNNKKGKYFS